MVPNGWSLIKLKDIGKCITGLTYSPKNIVDKGLLVLRSSNVQDSKLSFNDNVYVDLEVDNKSKTRLGDILLCVRNGSKKLIGKSAFIVKGNEQLAHGAFMSLFRSNETPDYTFQLFQSSKFFRQVNQNLGATINSINSGNLYQFKFAYPPFEERKKIAKILSTWDKAISTTERLIDNSKQQKKALMQQLLTGKKRLLDDSGKPFEAEWEEVKLSHFFERVMEKNNGQSKNVVTISAQHGLIRQEEFFKKSVASETLDNYFILRKGQFAYNKSYSNGYPMGAIKRLNRYDDAVVTSLYICFELKDEQLASSCFMEQFFESGLLNRGLTKVAAEGGRAHGLLNVKPADFMALSMAAPKKNEQQKIALVLTNADQEIELLKQQLADLKQEKKALMQQLLTGKRRVKIDDKEVA